MPIVILWHINFYRLIYTVDNIFFRLSLNFCFFLAKHNFLCSCLQKSLKEKKNWKKWMWEKLHIKCSYFILFLLYNTSTNLAFSFVVPDFITQWILLLFGKWLYSFFISNFRFPLMDCEVYLLTTHRFLFISFN